VSGSFLRFLSKSPSIQEGNYMERVNWQRTRDILMSLIFIGVIFWALWNLFGQFVEAIVILLLAMAVAFLLTPAVNLLVKWGFPRLLAALLAYILVLGAISGLAYELIVSLAQQVNFFSTTIVNFANILPKTYAKTLDFLNNQIGKENVALAVSQIQQQVYSFAQSLAGNVLLLATNALNLFLNIFLILVISFYLTLDGKRIRSSMVAIAPRSWLPNVMLFENALSRVVGNYIRGQLTLALIIGVCTSLICLVANLGNYALICGVLAFLFETIPIVGPALASITPILLSLLLGGNDVIQRTLLIVGLFIVLQALESNVLGPRIVGHAVGLHPVAAILALLIGAKLFGVFGALIATPIVAAGWVVITSIYHSARGVNADQVLARRRAPWRLRRAAARSESARRERSRLRLPTPPSSEEHVGDEASIEPRSSVDVPLRTGSSETTEDHS
jgi:predicted PurR-regulated permease PerM